MKQKKYIKCNYTNCPEKIKHIYSDIWKCKCDMFYCQKHTFNHQCIFINKLKIDEKIITPKVQKI